MGYIVKNSFYEGNTFHEQGSSFEHADDDYVAKCLNDGNIVVEGETSEQPVNSEPVAPASVEPTTLNPPAQVTPQGQTLTPEQVAQDFQNAGVGTSQSEPQQ